ncbi:hypothetical protein [Microbulbifer hainanensis]|uniref:hypothetical protein n=1 Tax=Microbulbifer hainanensis TaxID=2735675 RepID=UPI001865C9DA|nr:hypothetical protein [Microbulbifer hainanensis]
MKIRILCVLAAVVMLAACGQRADHDAGVEAESSAEQQPAETKTPPAKAEEPAEAGEPAEEAEVLIWVFRQRQNRQCYGGGMSLDESRAKLSDSGVAVHESHCGLRTDNVYTAGCGKPTGDILLHLIRGNALDAALNAGYGPAEQIKYQIVECPDDSAESPAPATSS